MAPNPLASLRVVPPMKDNPAGLVALGGTISPASLLAAVELGMFPWTGTAPIPWCSPEPRAVFHPGNVRCPRSLRKSRRNRGYRVTYDRAFEEVVAACAGTRRLGQPGTWITPNLVAAWTVLHERGMYHSVEVWNGDQLVGGLFGLAQGRVFLGDSMFHRSRDASKVAFVTLCEELDQAGYELVDGQAITPHLVSLGAQSVSRSEYMDLWTQAASGSFVPVSWRHGVRLLPR